MQKHIQYTLHTTFVLGSGYTPYIKSLVNLTLLQVVGVLAGLNLAHASIRRLFAAWQEVDW